MAKRRRSSFSSRWDDFTSNSRDELLQMMNDLELPYFPSMTTAQLSAAIRSRVIDDPILHKQTRAMYCHDRHTSRFNVPVILLHRLLFVAAIVISIVALGRLLAPNPYCGPGRDPKTCAACPDGATCRRGRVICPPGQILSLAGCRAKAQRRDYKWAERAARDIAARDGDCVELPGRLTVADFAELFPKTNITFLTSEPGFAIVVLNGTVRSLRPRPGFACALIARMEANPDFFGFLSVVGFTGVFVFCVRRRSLTRTKLARKIAKQVRKILATTDHTIYQYDIKVQMRAKYGGVDGVWKQVVRFVERDPHVCVGVAGSRHETYWMWVHADQFAQ
jgi:hypothetical protein